MRKSNHTSTYVHTLHQIVLNAVIGVHATFWHKYISMDCESDIIVNCKTFDMVIALKQYMIHQCLLSYQMIHICDHTHDESNSLYKTWLCVLLLCHQCTTLVTIHSSFFFIDTTYFGLTGHHQVYRLLWLRSLLLTIKLFCFCYVVALAYFFLCGLTVCFI
jgi:hypothetical protein